jgi:hypothetical protein
MTERETTSVTSAAAVPEGAARIDGAVEPTRLPAETNGLAAETFCAECGSVPCSCHLCSNCGELFCKSESCHLEAEHFDSADRAYDLAVDA